MKTTREKLLKLFQTLYPEVFLTLTNTDADKHRIDCAMLADSPQELKGMMKRFKKTFGEQ